MPVAADPVRRLMTEAVLSIDLDAPAGEILRYFREYPVHHLPVVDDARVVGMLSSADLLKLEMFLPRNGLSAVEYLNQNLRIERIMRQPVITISADEQVGNAARLMVEHGIHALPVTGSDGKLVGIITTTDIMNAALFPQRGA